MARPATIAQSVERPPCKRQVGSSILPGGFVSMALFISASRAPDRHTSIRPAERRTVMASTVTHSFIRFRPVPPQST